MPAPSLFTARLWDFFVFGVLQQNCGSITRLFVISYKPYFAFPTHNPRLIPVSLSDLPHNTRSCQISSRELSRGQLCGTELPVKGTPAQERQTRGSSRALRWLNSSSTPSTSLRRWLQHKGNDLFDPSIMLAQAERQAL